MKWASYQTRGKLYFWKMSNRVIYIKIKKQRSQDTSQAHFFWRCSRSRQLALNKSQWNKSIFKIVQCHITIYNEALMALKPQIMNNLELKILKLVSVEIVWGFRICLKMWMHQMQKYNCMVTRRDNSSRNWSTSIYRSSAELNKPRFCTEIFFHKYINGMREERKNWSTWCFLVHVCVLLEQFHLWYFWP